MLNKMLPKTKHSISLYIFIILLIYALRPSPLFSEHGTKSRRPFGIGYNKDYEKKTLFDLGFCSIIISVICAFVTL